MARGRMIARTAGVDSRLAQLSDPALGLYLLTIPHLDRDGLCDGRPSVVWGQAAPLRAAWQPIAGALILEWIDVGLVNAYGTEREPVLWFRGFKRHQEGMRYEREEASRFPPPPGLIRCPQHGLIEDADALSHLECKPRDQLQPARRDPANLGYSHQNPDLGRTKSGLSPGEDQEKFDHGGGGDRFSFLPSRSGKERGSGGKPNPYAADPQPTSLDLLVDDIEDGDLALLVEHWGELTQIAYEHSDWAGISRALDREHLLTLLAILHFLHVRADKITLVNPAAWVQAQLRDGLRPRLRPAELAELRRMADLILDERDAF